MSQLTADAVYGFTSAFLLDRFDNPQPTPHFHEELWDYACLPDRWVAMGAPRGHAKSTAITHAYVLANIMFRYRDHVLLVSDTEGQAAQFLSDIKVELTENTALIEAFEIKRLIKDTEGEVIGEFQDGKRFRLVARGSEQKVRGIKWRNKRPNLIVGDDLENDEIVLNEERRKKFRKWFYNALLPAGSDNCIVRIVGTILHFDSLLARLIPLEDDEGAVVTPLRITWSKKAQAKKSWKAVTFRAHPSISDASTILWEEKFPAKRLQEIRDGYLEDGNAEGYAQEYLNNPIDPENAYFKVEHFRGWDEDEAREPRQEFYAAIDMAISEADSAAYTAIGVIGVTPDGIIRTRHVERFRGDTLDIIEAMARVQRTWNVEYWVVEEENIAKSVGPVLYQSMERGEIPYMLLHMMKPNKDKVRRARPFQARVRAGTWLFDKLAEWWPELEQEMLHFPKGKFMDMVDALAWLGQMLDELYDAKTQEEVDDERWEEEYEEDYSDDSGEGINRHTGY